MTKGADSELQGWQPKQKVSRLPLVTKKMASVHKGRGAKDPSVRRGGDPRTLASRRHWLLQVVAATAGVSATVSYRFPPRLLLPPS